MEAKVETNKPGVKVCVGQIWQDNDPRNVQRYLKILAVVGAVVVFARVRRVGDIWLSFYPDTAHGPRTTKANLARFGVRNGYDFLEDSTP